MGGSLPSLLRWGGLFVEVVCVIAFVNTPATARVAGLPLRPFLFVGFGLGLVIWISGILLVNVQRRNRAAAMRSAAHHDRSLD